MPTKLGKGGAGPEDFDPDTGEYTAGASISRRGDKYWVHGDLRSRQITKDEYDLYKSKGYKEEFDEDRKKKFRFYDDWSSISTKPTFYDKEGFEVEVDEAEMEKFFKDNITLSPDELRSKLGIWYSSSKIGARLFGEYKDMYLDVLEEHNKHKSEIADEYLNSIGKISDWDSKDNSQKLQYCNTESNYNNYQHSLNNRDNRRVYDMYTSNCQRCVMAWYLNYLGWNVEAMPYDGSDYQNQFGKAESNKILYRNQPKIGYEFYPGMTSFKGNWSYSGFNIPEGTKYDYHGKSGEWQTTQFKRIKDQVSKMPENSVCFCSVKWRGYNSSHVFIVHNIGGEVSFIDPQDNSDASKYFDKSKYEIEAKWTSLLRINDFSLNGDTLKEIVSKKGESRKLYDERHYKKI